MTAHHPFLLESLAWKRAHVLDALAGLDEEALNTSYVTSGWTPLDLVRHLTVDVERYWFRAVVAGEPEAVAFAAGDGTGWRQAAPLSYDDVAAAYREEAARSDEIIASRAPDAPIAWEAGSSWPGAPRDLADVLVHVLTETATHAGHLDIVRELADGRQYLVVHP